MRLLATATALMLTVGSAQAETQVRVHYAIPTIWADVQQMLADAFMEANPDIEIVIDGPAEGYAEGVQRPAARKRRRHPARRCLRGPEPLAHS